MESFFLSESKNKGGQFFLVLTFHKSLLLYNVKISTGSAFKGGRSQHKLMHLTLPITPFYNLHL